ncbi:LysM peptidoglycan-binding domain-containing protein [Bacillus kexueae]|uniref:LysM peptidoglycan-binding domain-containing protein n=1 Tax=Aeribacillus kexueae TaxID=2078952 RepID=UPI001FAF177B|nr:LysM peptidoglycan-binding domain-containing protein [Bacillus kexueae]
MTKKNETYDQAQSLREQVIDEEKEQTGSYPPRSEVHRQKKAKKKVKVKYPIIRFLVIFFIFFPIMVLSIMYHLEKRSTLTNSSKESEQTVTVEYSSILPNPDIEKAEDGMDEKEVESTDAEEEKVDEMAREREEEIQKPKEQDVTSGDKVKGIDKNDVSTSNPSPEKKEPAPPKEEVKVVTHIVQPEETLYRIAMKYYGSRDGEETIRQYNGLNGNEIFVGQELKIPLTQ